MNILIPIAQNSTSSATLALGLDFEDSLSDIANPSRAFTNYGLTYQSAETVNGSYSLYNPPEPNGGDTNMVSTADSPELRLTGDFTVEFWHYNSGVGSTLYDGGQQTILGKGEPTGSGGGAETFSIINSYPILMSANGASASASTILQATSTVPLNAWTHHCWSRKGTTLKLFLNGILNTSTTWTGTWGNDAQPLNIGNQQDARLLTGFGYTSMGGYLDRLRIWQGCKYFSNFTPLTSLD
jgi:hypothetical protein